MEYFKLHLILGMVIHSKKSNVVGFNSVQNFSTNSYKKLNAFPCELSLEAAICKLYNIICFQAPNSTVLFNFDWSRSLVINNIRELPRYKVPQNIISTFSLKCILLLENASYFICQGLSPEATVLTRSYTVNHICGYHYEPVSEVSDDITVGVCLLVGKGTPRRKRAVLTSIVTGQVCSGLSVN